MQKNRMAELEQMLLEDPADTFLKYALALEYISGGNLEKGAEYLKQVLDSDKNYLAAYYQLGKTMESLEKTEEAKALYFSGMEIARSKGDQRSFSEFKTAFDELSDEE